MDQKLELTLLDTFQATCNGKSLHTFDSPRVQALLTYLLLHRSAPQPRQQVAFQLWPTSTESQARTNLRKLFWQLRQALPAADEFIHCTNQTLHWHANAPVAVDLFVVQQHLQRLQEQPWDQTTLQQLSDCYGGKLLPNCYDDWIEPWRQQLHQDVIAALTRLVTVLENQAAHAEGIRYAQRLLALDPLEERSYQQLMRLQALNGNRAGALRTYQSCVAMLERELDVGPSRETVALYQQLCNQRPQTRAPATPATPHAKRIALVGRHEEWQLLQRTWQQRSHGPAHLLCIQGEAGIGKTRLAEELLDWVRDQGALAIRARCHQAQEAVAYAPVTELLRAEQIRKSLAGLEPIWLAELTRLLPELREQYPTLPPPQPLVESWQRQRFCEALAHALLQADQPLLIVIDDLQWCEREMVEWLDYLLRFNAKAPLLVVATLRTGDLGATSLLPTFCHNLQRDGLSTLLPLTPLTATETVQLAQQLIDTAPVTTEPSARPGAAAGAADDDPAAALFHATAGNPLFVIEMARAAKAAALPTMLPPKIRAVIQAQLAQLSPNARTVVQVVAVIGGPFSYALLAAIVPLDEERLVDALDELWQRQLICEESTTLYALRHEQIRNVAYAEISCARRRIVHRRVAQALAQLQDGASEQMDNLSARHHRQAGNEGLASESGPLAGAGTVTRQAGDKPLAPERTVARPAPFVTAVPRDPVVTNQVAELLTPQAQPVPLLRQQAWLPAEPSLC